VILTVIPAKALARLWRGNPEIVIPGFDPESG
jgi:hypothetical protein